MQLEDLRRARLDQLAALIQSTYRGYAARKLYLRRKECAIRILRAWRFFKVFSNNT